MTSHAQPGRKRAGTARAMAPQLMPWAALGLVVVMLLFLAYPGRGRLWAMLTRRTAPKAGGPLSLTVIHSNDTWGYVQPCG